ncbi:MAG TPA: pilus assembly protein TadG-related protein [Gaiellaceae bacterium]|nr:pilus assembly protein TadG-related protein [Gaiellaceae bacterium]
MERHSAAKRAMERVRDERGQAIVLTAVWMIVLLGMAGLVIDAGSWYKGQRDLQAVADAAALAGAQDLPDNVTNAAGDAQSYATKNGYTLPTSGVAFASKTVANDAITVNVNRAAPTFFTRLFGLTSVPVRASATAKNGLLGKARYVAPITVNLAHPMLSGRGCPCFGEDTTLPLDKRGAPGAFGLLDLDNGKGNGASMLGSWIMDGYNGFLGLGGYSSNTGAKFNSANVENALDARINSTLLFPVYDTLTGNGTNAVYNVVAWVGFYLTGYSISGSSGSLYGHFTEINWQGIEADPSSGEPNLGARVVSLIN